ncbi:MAG: hypothetical protein QXK23_08050, partial [Ignisphaera sp.]
ILLSEIMSTSSFAYSNTFDSSIPPETSFHSPYSSSFYMDLEYCRPFLTNSPSLNIREPLNLALNTIEINLLSAITPSSSATTTL